MLLQLKGEYYFYKPGKLKINLIYLHKATLKFKVAFYILRNLDIIKKLSINKIAFLISIFYDFS